MADKYKYSAVDKDGKKITGFLLADSLDELSAKLSIDGKYLIRAKISGSVSGIRKIKMSELSEFLKQLGTLLEAGVSLVRALKIITESETITKREKVTYGEIMKQVKQGNALSVAMDKQHCFPDLLLNMIRSAEMSGNLDKTMLNMSVHYDKQFKLSQRIKGSLTYSKVLGVVIVIVVIILMTFVLPMFSKMFEGMADLPLPTRILYAISGFMTKYWIFIILLGIIGVYVLSIFMRGSKVKFFIDRLKVRAPVFGKLNKKVYTSRFAATLSVLYSSGIPMITALGVAKNTIGNYYIEKQFEDVLYTVRAGGTLSSALAKVDGFVKKLQSSIFIGEETGYLDNMLKSTSDMLDYEAEIATAKLVSYIEPTMIAIMAFVVGFIMIAVLTPIYSSYSSLGAGVL